MSYDQILDELDRVEAECGCDLPELSDPTPRERAQAILECEDPPCGEDLDFIQSLVSE